MHCLLYCMLDAPNVLDCDVEYCKFVHLLLSKKLSAVVIRLLFHTYLFHFTN